MSEAAPKLSLPEPPPGTDMTVHFRSFANPEILGAFFEFSKSAVRLRVADAETIELIRIRNAVAQSCEY
jgi:hypothetical protein